MGMCGRRHVCGGFTLIEVLVTLTVFVAVLSAMVAGLRSGIHAWRLVRRHQVQEAALQRAFGILGEDFPHAAVVSGDEPALVETKGEDGGESIVLTTLSPRRRQRVGLGAVWNRVEYRVVRNAATDEDELVRVCQPHVGPSPVGDAPLEESLLAGVENVRFDYVTPEGTVPAWDDGASLPGVVIVTLTRGNGGVVRRAAGVPVGMIGSQAHGM